MVEGSNRLRPRKRTWRQGHGQGQVLEAGKSTGMLGDQKGQRAWNMLTEGSVAHAEASKAGQQGP